MSGNLHGTLQPPELPPLDNHRAEVSIVGTVLLNNSAFDAVAESLKPDHFSLPHLGEMFRICGEMIGAGKLADPATTRNAFRANDAIIAYGPDKAVVEVLTKGLAPLPAPVLQSYAREVADLFARRSIRQMAQAALWGGNEYEGDDASQIISRMQETLQGLSQGVDTGRKPKTAGEAAADLLRETEESWRSGSYLSGMDCGYETLNARIRGFRAGAMYVIAGRPGMGKTALGLGVAVRMALASGRGLFWSGEMSAEELMGRVVSAKCGLTLDTVLTGMIDGRNGPEPVSDKTMARIVAAGMDARRIPLLIDDREGLTIQQIASRARRMKREKEGLNFVVIDYLGLVRQSDVFVRTGNRVGGMAEISAQIACMARELKVPVIALSQLNRQSEGREDRRPTMSDLAQSGAIEQDARCIIGLYREEYALLSRIGEDGHVVRNANESDVAYEKRAAEFDAALERSRGKGEAIILKNRGGKSGIVPMWFEGPAAWFRDIVEDERGEAW